MKKSVLSVLIAAASINTYAAECRTIHWKAGQIIEVSSMLGLGTRISFPTELIGNPVKSTNLWDVEGAATEVLLKPNSTQAEGGRAIVRAFTKDGFSFDIAATRVSNYKMNDVCVNVTLDGQMFTDQLRGQMAANRMSMAGGIAAQNELNADLRQKMIAMQQSAEDEKKKAIMEALNRFRYHIYTRYTWSKGSGFEAKGLISDVYDDGRFTYIRLYNPNRGLLSVETTVGGKNAIVPTDYSDANGMYVIAGIYPDFTLRMDEAKITVKRQDAESKGEY
ncbi:hypothetical protein WH50_06430 [Pokkaliibacter plantistimulans]|uniref:Conjugal transfer protein n=1 Tax=Pokkaliibacter plantistimulans TaxID=1635171 RepID=A0ABX5M126_9GAMM|nr:TrbG/VirB9 family P-type conjugative transfer protein [Pokkaliibacter plantistimulans]PXF32099.1 hypothetical protein WH50_06430 [Pokkaliibacter plantistimulans]